MEFPSWKSKYPRLFELSELLADLVRKGQLFDTSSVLLLDKAHATAARAFLAAARRDVRELRIMESEIALFKAYPELHYSFLWNYYCTLGIAGLIERPELLIVDNRATLPTYWQAVIEQLQFWVDHCSNTIVTLSSSVEKVSILQNQPIPIVRARIQGVEGWYVIDTGAPSTVISTQTASEVGLEFLSNPPRTVYDGSGKTINLYPAVLDTLQVGRLSAHCFPVNVASFHPDLNVAGILSPQDLLRTCSYQLDLATHSFWILSASQHDQSKEQFRLPLLWQDNVPMLPCGMDQQCCLAIDSGAGVNIINNAILRDLPTSSDFSLANITTSSLRHSVDLKGPYRLVISDPSCGSREYDFMSRHGPSRTEGLLKSISVGCLGVPWFKQGVWLAGPDSQEVYFTPQIT